MDEQHIDRIKSNSDIIEIQAAIVEQAAKGILDALKRREYHRVLNNIVNMKKALYKINEEFAEILPLVE